jgi:hypothetical protein
MLAPLYTLLGLANNALLILIFALRGRPDRARTVRRVGMVYLLLAIPASLATTVAVREGAAVQYTVFLAIFLAYLTLEGLYDFVLKIPFRRNWKLLAPYLALYYAMNYGFVVMTWQQSRAMGIVMLVLFAVQIVANVLSHPHGDP